MQKRRGYRIFIYHRDRLEWSVRADAKVPPQTVSEQSRRQWRVQRGDLLVFTEGSGLDIRFVSYATVTDVESGLVEKGEANLWSVRAQLEAPTPLPEGLVLRRFIYSLTRIANFSRPWLHLQHRYTLPVEDLETLRESRLAWDRTVFYGLLQHLPTRWREFLEFESRALRARQNIQETDWQWSERKGEPVTELLSLVDMTLLTPIKLASQIEKDWKAALESVPLSTAQVVDSNSEPDSMHFATLVQGASEQETDIERRWTQVNAAVSEVVPQEQPLTWRPHRW